jgi:hypothetical protein
MTVISVQADIVLTHGESAQTLLLFRRTAHLHFREQQALAKSLNALLIRFSRKY